MSIVPPVPPQPHDPANPPPPAGADEFALQVRLFWEKNRSVVLLFIAAIFVALLAREGWQLFADMRERGVQEEYAKVGDNSAQLARFAEANSGHALAGVAWLRLADEAYSKDDFKTAAAHYAKAAGALEQAALKSRARLGGALSQLAAGDAAAAESALKALSADAKATTAFRAEAAYHVATIAQGAGRKDDALKALEEITKIDPAGLWAQRGFMLRTQLEAADKPAAPAPGTPTIEFKPKG